MIGQILQLLALSNFYGETELIDIAKGKYKIETSVKGVWKQKLRELKAKK